MRATAAAVAPAPGATGAGAARAGGEGGAAAGEVGVRHTHAELIAELRARKHQEKQQQQQQQQQQQEEQQPQEPQQEAGQRDQQQAQQHGEAELQGPGQQAEQERQEEQGQGQGHERLQSHEHQEGGRHEPGQNQGHTVCPLEAQDPREGVLGQLGLELQPHAAEPPHGDGAWVGLLPPGATLPRLIPRRGQGGNSTAQQQHGSTAQQYGSTSSAGTMPRPVGGTGHVGSYVHTVSNQVPAGPPPVLLPITNVQAPCTVTQHVAAAGVCPAEGHAPSLAVGKPSQGTAGAQQLQQEQELDGSVHQQHMQPADVGGQGQLSPALGDETGQDEAGYGDGLYEGEMEEMSEGAEGQEGDVMENEDEGLLESDDDVDMDA